jgi:hypothetical protein
MFSLAFSDSHAQRKKTEAELKLDTLISRLSGVKFAKLIASQEYIEILKNQAGNNVASIDHLILNGISDYFNRYFGIDVIISAEQESITKGHSSSYCDFVSIQYEIEPIKGVGALKDYPLILKFIFCDLNSYELKLRVSAVGNGSPNYRANVITSLLLRLTDKKVKYDIKNRLALKHLETVINQDAFKKYLDSSKNLNKFEGIYEIISSDANNPFIRVGLYNHNGTFKIIYFNGADFEDDWYDGEVFGVLTSTKSENDFLAIIYDQNKNELKGSVYFNNSNAFELRIRGVKGVDRYIKIK